MTEALKLREVAVPEFVVIVCTAVDNEARLVDTGAEHAEAGALVSVSSVSGEVSRDLVERASLVPCCVGAGGRKAYEWEREGI